MSGRGLRNVAWLLEMQQVDRLAPRFKSEAGDWQYRVTGLYFELQNVLQVRLRNA